MTNTSFLPRFLITCAAVLVAAFFAWQLWVYYMLAPWTRDGRVRADIVEVAPDESGLVSDVYVHDNQFVHVGDPLFQIDNVRFTVALQAAQATVAKDKAALAQAVADARRYNGLPGNAVSSETRDQSNTAVLEAQAELDQANANEAEAVLNLTRATVRATVNGTITNFSMRPGDFVSRGSAIAALVDSGSLYVDGYFEETKLPRIAVGDAARVTLLGGGPVLQGHVESIDAGITDHERSASPNLLADVNPTFTWVRLAQRVPVRITLDNVPANTRLIAGLTATVEVEPK
ncbi:MAG: efflux transporter periplasmic adaptor subunit [Acidocella sp. 20-57-95]|nr:MAG: efflux transporter periplasmic adaptor subunit [Acidocella sp. 20-57-95]OYV58035.1 MAG: efflux transporter periplasmic adaptor subunit [Acidocella sp. 21-58-7]HQT65473.1 HlyD family secretion protein [Acidocella sp.]HQU05346.1 HlyD family secretion protein [Acidocella sp.]